MQNIIYSMMDTNLISGVRVTFVGNAGFLITADDKKILIDAIFDGFLPGYTLPRAVQESLVNAQPPFNNVDLILVTHAHDDHFSSAMVQRHMQKNPKGVILSTTQVANQLAELGERVISVDPVAGSPVSAEARGIQVEAIYLSHGYPPNDPNEIFNNAYIVTVNGIKIFHTGDIANLHNVASLKLLRQNIDLAFIQHFYLQDEMCRNILTNNIGAKFLFPIHYQFTEPAFDANIILSNYPDAIIFNGELESWFMPLPDK